MTKVYARQVPPEYQESPLFFGDWDENVFVFGNKHYTPHAGRLEDIRRGLENIADALDDMQRGAAWIRNGNFHAVIWYELPRDSGAGYTRAERLKMADLAMEYCGALDSFTKLSILCAALELITGQGWSAATICGCCQSDWQNVIYPAAYGPEWLEAFETEYFNTGSEWTIHDGETPPESAEDVTGYNVYCLGWNDEKIRAEIAEYENVSPENVVLYNFTGWTRAAAYKEA